MHLIYQDTKQSGDGDRPAQKKDETLEGASFNLTPSITIGVGSGYLILPPQNKEEAPLLDGKGNPLCRRK